MTDTINFHVEHILTKTKESDSEDERHTLGSFFYDLINETESKCQQT